MQLPETPTSQAVVSSLPSPSMRADKFPPQKGAEETPLLTLSSLKDLRKKGQYTRPSLANLILSVKTWAKGTADDLFRPSGVYTMSQYITSEHD